MVLDAGRHESRQRAVNLLYEADMKGVDVSILVDALPIPLEKYTAIILEAVSEARLTIDDYINGAAEGWSLDRMAALDRNILRVAVGELLSQQDVPVPVIIDEAVELAKEFSTEESGKFINGILSTLAAKLRAGE